MTEPICRLRPRNDIPLPGRHLYGANVPQTLFSVSVWIHCACGISAESLLDAAHSSFLSNYAFVCSDDLTPQLCDYLSQITSAGVCRAPTVAQLFSPRSHQTIILHISVKTLTGLRIKENKRSVGLISFSFVRVHESRGSVKCVPVSRRPFHSRV